MNNYNDQNQQNAQQYGQPAAPAYGQPADQQYAQPAAPAYGQPAAPVYAAPEAAPAPAKAGNPVLIPFIVGLAGSVLMIISLFLPYFSFVGFSFSLTDFFNADKLGGLLGSDFEEAAAGVGVIVGVLLVFYGLTVLFAAIKKPIPQLIFAIISIIIFSIINMLVSAAFSAGISMLDSSMSFPFGFGVYLFYIAAIAAIAGSIWMMVARKKVAAPAPAPAAMPH